MQVVSSEEAYIYFEQGHATSIDHLPVVLCGT